MLGDSFCKKWLSNITKRPSIPTLLLLIYRTAKTAFITTLKEHEITLRPLSRLCSTSDIVMKGCEYFYQFYISLPKYSIILLCSLSRMKHSKIEASGNAYYFFNPNIFISRFNKWSHDLFLELTYILV